MHKSNIAKHFANSRHLYLACCASVLLTIFLCHNSVINTDGYLYFRAANLILAGEYNASYHIITWPGYPALLAVLKNISSLQYDVLIYALNLLSSVTLLVVFWHWLSLLKFSTTTRNLALLLLLSHPTLNGFRDMAIRDYPYWAALMSGIYMLFRYQQHPTLRRCLLWHLCMLLAAVFRFEGIVFWTLAPLGLLLASGLGWKSKAVQVLLLQSPLIITATIILACFGMPGSSNISYLSRLDDVFSIAVLQHLTAYATAITKDLPESISNYSKILALGFAFLILFANLALKFIKTLQIAFVAIAFWGGKNNCLPKEPGQRRLLLWCLLIAVVIPTGYYFQQMLTSSRFLTPSLLLLIVIAAPALEALWDKNRQILRVGVMLAISWLTLDSLISMGATKAYYRDAGNWLTEQTSSSQITTYSNTPEASFYGRDKIRDQQTSLPLKVILGRLAQHELDGFNYLLLEADDNQASTAIQSLQRIKARGTELSWKQFANRRGDQVIVVKLIN